MFWYLIQELTVDVLKVFLQERVSALILEQIVDVPVLLSGRRSLKCAILLERIQHRTVGDRGFSGT